MEHSRRWFWRLMMAVLLLGMIGSGAGLIREQFDASRQRRMERQMAQAVWENASEDRVQDVQEQRLPEQNSVVQEENMESLPYVSPIDFAALTAKNPDTVGWIRVPDTKIDYPIVQSTDNQYYLHKNFAGEDSVYGAIYLDADSQSDFSGWNNPIYGHHMKDGSMFQNIVKFKDPDFFQAHRYLEIYTPKRTIHLKTLACYYSDSDGIVRQTSFPSQEAFTAWVKERLAPCSFAEIPKQPITSMFVFVTCSYEQPDARTLLFAAEVDELEMD